MDATGGSLASASQYSTSANTSSSQLADRFPQLDLPQRVDPPPQMSAPARARVMSKDEQIRESAFSPAAHSKRKYDLQRMKHQASSSGDDGASAQSSTSAASLKAAMDNTGPTLAKVKDFSTLVASSRRAGRHQMESAALFSMGLLYDNISLYGKALDCYKKFRALCQKLGDRVGEALAYNCIGVDLMHMAAREAGDISFNGAFAGVGSRHLQTALQYHSKHLDIADDAGQFVAHSNLALALGALGRPVDAAKHHQEALRIAIRLQSAHGQSISVGNLGLLGARQGDLTTAKACMDQHLQLVQSTHDASAEANAWLQLGLLANAETNFEQAARYFEQARTIAARNGEQGTLKRANCNIGVARGNLRLREHMQQLAAHAEAHKLKS